MIALLLVVAALASGCSTGTSTDSGTGTGRTGASTTGPSTTATTTPTPTPTPSETGTTSPTAAVTPTSMLGPAGYRSLKLGMSYADAVATGQLKRSAPAVWGWVVKGHPQTSVCLTKEGGLMAIFADATMASPEGIHLGSTLAEVNAAYPNLKRSVEFFNVPINATSRYEFLITVNSKTVYEWKPQHHQQTCFN